MAIDVDDGEKAYNDVNRWYYFDNPDEGGIIGIYARCHCGRFLKKGLLLMNLGGEITLRGWICKEHGDIEPYFDRDIEFLDNENC